MQKRKKVPVGIKIAICDALQKLVSKVFVKSGILSKFEVNVDKILKNS